MVLDILLTILVVIIFIIILRPIFGKLSLFTRLLSVNRSVRWMALRFSRMVGFILYKMKRGWVPPVFWLLATALVVGIFSTFDSSIFRQGFRAWLGTLNSSSFMTMLTAIRSNWVTILLVYTILLLLWWVWQAGRRVVVEEFVDFTNTSGDEAKSTVKGLATLLVVRLGQLRDLYQVVDEQRAILTSVWVHQSIDATINVEDVSQFLQSAVSAQSEFSLGVLKIPVGTLMSLIGRIVQGPRILGSLYRDNDMLILTAQYYDGKSSQSWRVDYAVPADQSTQQGNDYLTRMVEEMACRMFTDLALRASVRWRATASFCEGLRAYRDCLRTPKDRRLNLEKAERKFIETLAEDQKFNLAYYDLGVVYTELGQMDAAENAFKNAIEQNPASWNAFYAMALHRYQMALQASKDARINARHTMKHQHSAVSSKPVTGNGNVQATTQSVVDEAVHAILNVKIEQDILTKTETAIDMCKRVVELGADSATLAKAHQLKGSAHELLCELQYLELCQLLVDKIQQQKVDSAIVSELEQLVNEEVDKLAHYKRDEFRYKHLCKSVLHLTKGDDLDELRYLASNILSNRKDASRSRGWAIGQSWRALCLAELQGKGRAGLESSEIPQLETLASVCLCDKAAEYRRREYWERKKFRKAEILLHQALTLNHADADYLAFYSFELGNTFYRWGLILIKDEEKLDQAKSAYRRAIRIRQEKIVYWASLALTYAQLRQFDKALNAIKRVLDYAADASDEDFEEAFECITGKHGIFTLLPSDEKSKLIRQHMEVVKVFLQEEREVCEAENRKKRGELTLEGYEQKLETNLQDHNTDDQVWGYAHSALALGRLSSYTDNPKKRSALAENYRTAIGRLKQILGKDISSWEHGQISWTLGSLYLEQAKLQEADSVFTNGGNQEELAHDSAAMAEKYFRDALDHLEKQYDDEIRLRRIRALLAQSLLKQGSYEKYLQALKEVKRAVTIDSMGYFDREVLGDVFFSLNEFEEAIETWENALLWRNASLSEPDAPDIYYKLGNAQIELGQHCLEPSQRKMLYQKAIYYLKKALELYKNDQQRQKGQACYWLGILYRKLGRYGEALTYFRISQALGFANLTSTFYLALAYLKNNEYDESMKLFQALFSEADERLSELGDCRDDGFKRIVEPETKEPITLIEFKALACFGQALAYTESDMDLEEAEKHIVKVSELIQGLTKPHFQAEYQHYRGWIQFKRDGDITIAIKDMQQALALNAHAEIYLHLALVHEASLEKTKELIHVQSIMSKVRAYCQHVQALDFNGEYSQLVADLLQRLEKRSKDVNKSGMHAHRLPTQSNHVNSRVGKQTTTY